MGTWEAVLIGAIYDAGTGPDVPIEGAAIRYRVLHSYFPEIQQGRPNRATTDAQGHFRLLVMVHDTDSVLIEITAKGYVSYEERLSGFDLIAGRNYELGLQPAAIATTAAP